MYSTVGDLNLHAVYYRRYMYAQKGMCFSLCPKYSKTRHQMLLSTTAEQCNIISGSTYSFVPSTWPSVKAEIHIIRIYLWACKSMPIQCRENDRQGAANTAVVAKELSDTLSDSQEDKVLT